MTKTNNFLLLIKSRTFSKMINKDKKTFLLKMATNKRNEMNETHNRWSGRGQTPSGRGYTITRHFNKVSVLKKISFIKQIWSEIFQPDRKVIDYWSGLIPRTSVCRGAPCRAAAGGWRRTPPPPPWRWSRCWRPSWRRSAGRTGRNRSHEYCCWKLRPPSKPAWRHETNAPLIKSIWYSLLKVLHKQPIKPLERSTLIWNTGN